MQTQEDLRKVLQMQEPEQYTPITAKCIDQAFIPQDILDDLKGTELLEMNNESNRVGLGIAVYDLRQLRE